MSRPSWLTVPNARTRLRSDLAQRLEAAEQHREHAEPDHDRAPRRRDREHRREPGDQVDAGLHHGRRVEVRAHRGGRRHRAGQPEVEREDRRLAERADQEQHQRGVDDRPGRRRGEDLEMLDVPASTTISTTPISITSPPSVVTSSACSAARRLARAAVVVADEQVRQHARELPEHHEHDEVVGEDEPVHRAREGEQHGGELPDALGLAAEVPAAVEHDERADPGDDERHEPRERVHAHRQLDAERRDPVECLERNVSRRAPPGSGPRCSTNAAIGSSAAT